MSKNTAVNNVAKGSRPLNVEPYAGKGKEQARDQKDSLVDKPSDGYIVNLLTSAWREISSFSRMQAPSTLSNISINIESEIIGCYGVDRRLDEKNVLSAGIVHRKNNDYTIAKGESATINGVEITAGDDDVRVFLNGEKPDGEFNYVSFDMGKKSLRMTSDHSTILRFGQKNPFIPLDRDSRLEMKVDTGWLEVINRDNLGQIPLVVGDSSGHLHVINGKRVVSEESYQFAIVNDGEASDEIRSAPFEYVRIGDLPIPAPIIFESSTLLEKGQSVVFDDCNNLQLLRYGSSEKSAYLNLALYTAGSTPAAFMNRYPCISLDGSLDESDVGATMFYMSGLTPAMAGSIKYIFYAEDISAKCGPEAPACAFPDGGIVLSSNNFSEAIIQHEAAHALTFQLEKGSDLKDQWTGSFGYGLGEDEIYPTFQKVSVRGEDGVVKLYYASMHCTYAMGIYAQSATIPESELIYEAGCNMLVDYKLPAFGFAEGYGAENYREDIATMVEAVVTTPELLRSILQDPENPYREIYARKLYILREYGFINETDYNYIVG